MNTEHNPRCSGDQLGLRLHVNTGDSGSQALELKPGRITIGRGANNDIRLEHPTVSEAHCEIDVERATVTIRDLGSTNGTFVDGEPVSEAVLEPGQKLQLGDVELVLDHEGPSENGEAAAQHERIAESQPASASALCGTHRQTSAGWMCTECQRHWCAACVKKVKLDVHKTVTLCPACDALCERTGGMRTQATQKSFAVGLIAALSYPLQPAGLVLLLLAAVLQVLTTVGGRWFIGGGLSLIFGVAAGLYVLAFLRQIVLSSADGEDALPQWPELDAQSLSETMFLFLGTSVVCFGPWTVCSVWGRLEGETAQLVCHVLLGLGAFVFPMALLAVIMYDSLAALNPISLVSSISRTAPRYITLCLFLSPVVGLGFLAEAALRSAGFTFVAAGTGGLLSLYSALVTMRVIGWFYYYSKEILAWR